MIYIYYMFLLYILHKINIIQKTSHWYTVYIYLDGTTN